MKQKNLLLFRLVVLVTAMMCALGAAAAEAYANYTPENTTLTFYYDNQRASRTGTTYDLNTGSNDTGWDTDGTKSNVTQVVFDPSFANARPTTTYDWFYYMTNLQSITGISYLNTSEVTDMQYMFYHCSALTSLDVSGFNTSKVTNMRCIFSYCEKLTSLDVSGFNTSKVIDMKYMFFYCPGLTSLDVSSFNTSYVTNMEGMFYYGTALTSLDLSSFNTTNVTDMSSMFYNCRNLTTIYVGNEWSTNAVTSSRNMFYNCPSLVGGQGTTFDENHVDAEYAHIDDGPSSPGYFSEKEPEAYACYTPENTTLTFYYDKQRSSRTGTTYYLNTGNIQPDWVLDETYRSVTQVMIDPSFADARPTSTHMWFFCMENVTSIAGISYLNTTEVTDMAAMFMECNSLTSLDLSHFNTAKVTDMFNMFYGCSNLTNVDLSSFNTAKVTDMRGMFRYCSMLTSLDLSSFNTATVHHMAMMFLGDSNLSTIYVGSGWSTASVNYSEDMFLNCTSLVGGQGTTYDANHIDKTYAHLDGGTSNPGYFTAKNASQRGDINGDGLVNVADVTALIQIILNQ